MLFRNLALQKHVWGVWVDWKGRGVAGNVLGEN